MSNFQYLDKRDDRGVMLRYSAIEMIYEMTQKAYKYIDQNEIINILSSQMPIKYVELYYKKMLYEALSPIAHQIKIHHYDKKNIDPFPKRKIDAENFPCIDLLKKIWLDDYDELKLSYLNKINKDISVTVKQKLKNTYYYVKSHLLSQQHSNISWQQNLGSGKIAVNYIEGFDANKRSDIFWLENSGIDPSSVVVYYESPQMMTRLDAEQTGQEFFDTLGIKQIKLWQYFPKKNEDFEKLKLELRSIKNNNSIDAWLNRTAINLCNRCSFWLDFFVKNNVKIHMDPTEWGLETIIKQIAIYKAGGLYVGKLRSYPTNIKGGFFGYYPNDLFFTWGVDSAKKIQSLNPHISNIIISGFPYRIKKDNKLLKKRRIEQKYNFGTTKFNLLLLDSNHSSNRGLMQTIPTDDIVAFYDAILSWVIEDKDIGLLIKPKKAHFLNAMPDVLRKIKELERNNQRVHLVKDSFQKMPNSYLYGIDMVIGTSTFFPSAVLECGIRGKRAVFYDYPNLRQHEPSLYKWGENQVIFPKLEKMIADLKEYKNDHTSKPEIGDWSSVQNELDSFRDDKGGERIGTYIRWLLESFDKGKSREESIKNANKIFSESWGIDKIYRHK